VASITIALVRKKKIRKINMYSCTLLVLPKPTLGSVNVFERGALFAALLGLLVVTAPAATIRVPVDQPTIQGAINAANNGDLILVWPGTYFEHIDYHGKAISLYAKAGPTQTIIDGGNTGTAAVTFQMHEGAQSVLSGFTIQHATATSGISLLLASPTIIGNVFQNNVQQTGGFGAAIGGNNSSPVIENNTFISNSCDTQFDAGVVSFINGSSPHIINNIFMSNPCSAITLGLPQGTSPVVANNTIVQNRVGVRVDARVPTSAHLYANNILVANNVGLQVDFLVSGNEPTWTNNLVFNNGTNYSGIPDQTGQHGNISSDPRFLSQVTFQLRRTSPAVDAGTLSVPGLPPTDFAGNPRVFDGNGDGSALPDIGALEFIP
jgi:serine protease